MNSSGIIAATVVLAFGVTGYCDLAQPAEVTGPDETRNDLAGEVELARLIDLSALKLGLNLEYDAKVLGRAEVTLRFERAITDEELWQLTKAFLASRGFAVVRVPGTDIMRIVRAQDAPGAAGIERGAGGARAGFVRVVTELEHQRPKEVMEAVRPLVSRQGGSVSRVGGTDLVLIADHMPRVEEILSLIERIDVPGQDVVVESVALEHRGSSEAAKLLNTAATAFGAVTGRGLAGKAVAYQEGSQLLLIAPEEEMVHWRTLVGQIDRRLGDVVVERVEVEFIEARTLVNLVESATQAHAKVTGTEAGGKLIPSSDGNSLVLVAPRRRVELWREMIGRFDVRQVVERRTYTPRHFEAGEVGRLLEEVARDRGPRGSGDRWRVVINDLTGAIIVSATAREHARIEALMERLEEAPVAARRPVRTFPIRNRGVTEVLGILRDLIDAGVLERESEVGGPSGAPGERQQSRREVLPRGAEPLGRATSDGDGASADRGSGGEVEEGAGGRRAGSMGADEPALSLTADETTNTLIAIGDPRRLDQLEALIRALDVRQAQVMLEVLVMAITDNQSLNLGVELQKMDVSGSTMFDLASLFGLGSFSEDGQEVVTGQGGTALVLDPGDFRVLVRALETLNKGRTLNIPKVLVNNNQQALLDSVLQQPFTTTNASNTVATTAFGGTQDAGTSVRVTPHVAEGDHLVLEYNVSISQFTGLSADPNIPPPRQQNSLESVATIPDGYTVALGGLESVVDTRDTSRVPLIGSIPLVGELFKNRTNATNRSRFFVFIRAHVMRHDGFEDLKYISAQEMASYEVDDGWPEVEAQVIR